MAPKARGPRQGPRAEIVKAGNRARAFADEMRMTLVGKLIAARAKLEAPGMVADISPRQNRCLQNGAFLRGVRFVPLLKPPAHRQA
jgi:hypothetical protein